MKVIAPVVQVVALTQGQPHSMRAFPTLGLVRLVRRRLAQPFSQRLTPSGYLTFAHWNHWGLIFSSVGGRSWSCNSSGPSSSDLLSFCFRGVLASSHVQRKGGPRSRLGAVSMLAGWPERAGICAARAMQAGSLPCLLLPGLAVSHVGVLPSCQPDLIGE